jgi:hypothetical protein
MEDHLTKLFGFAYLSTKRNTNPAKPPIEANAPPVDGLPFAAIIIEYRAGRPSPEIRFIAQSHAGSMD